MKDDGKGFDWLTTHRWLYIRCLRKMPRSNRDSGQLRYMKRYYLKTGYKL